MTPEEALSNLVKAHRRADKMKTAYKEATAKLETAKAAGVKDEIVRGLVAAWSKAACRSAEAGYYAARAERDYRAAAKYIPVPGEDS